MNTRIAANRSSRRGAVVVLTAVLIVIMLGIVAFAVDVGFILVVRTQLQAAVDSAALAAGANLSGSRTQLVAVGQQFGAYHNAGGKAVNVNASDIETGMWDPTARSFTPSTQVGNAVRVTARRNSGTGANNLFFGRIFGANTFDAQASAVASSNPRDFCFVVDLSGSMNDDTEPGWGSGLSSGQYASVRRQMMQDLFSDFGFGSYPGATQSVGQPLGVSSYNALVANGGPLTRSSIPAAYRIGSGDSSAVKKQKAYAWMIASQITSIMPNAKPSFSNTSYWATYLDAVINRNSVIGYRTYAQFLMENGRERRPDGATYAPLSVSSPDCPYHSESTAGGTFSFPPREQPTHSCRRSVIAAIQEIVNKNRTVSDPNQRDWVSIVTFDRVNSPRVHYPLSSDHTAAMQACTTLQAVSTGGYSTATETGLITAQNHLKPQSQGGAGRENTQKIVVLLTDGMANLKISSDSAVSSYRAANPNANFYGGSRQYPGDAALMQSDMIHAKHWQLHPVGIGLATDYDFMDRMARMGATANGNGQSVRTSGDPSAYEIELSAIFKKIVDNPQVRLVQ